MPKRGGIQYSLTIDQAAIERLAGGPDVKAGLEIIGQEGERVAKEHVAVDTGNLRRSITHELGQHDKLNPYVRIGTNVEYGLFQEIGTERMPAHPYLRPAFEYIKRLLKG